MNKHALIILLVFCSCHKYTYYDCTCRLHGIDSTFYFGKKPDNQDLTKTICDSLQLSHPADSCYVIKQSRATPM